MKLIKPGYEILPQPSGLDGIYKQIEIAGRTCYKSESKGDDPKKFVDRMAKSFHCYTGDTEILTINGWVKFKNYNGCKVASINTDGELNKFETPSNIIKREHNGLFYNYPSMGIEVTDKHRMFGMFANKYEDRNGEFKGSVFECDTDYYDANQRKKTLGERWFRTLSSCNYNPQINPYYQLVGFWLGDGIANTPKNSLNFHLKRERKVEYLKDLCNKLNFKYTYIKNRFKITEVGLGATFYSNYVKDGIKYIDPTITDQSIIYSIIDGLINSDGSKQPTGTTFMNKSDYLINFVLSKGCIVGYNVVEGTIATNGTRILFFLKRNHILNNDSRRGNSKVIISYKTQEVYCVTVSTGLIMVRGVNGKTSICGNCAMLEHGTVYLIMPNNCIKYIENNYSKVFHGDGGYYITSNLRVLHENDWLSDLQYLCEPTQYHEKRHTVRFVTDRATANQFVRHRAFSFAQESQRYVNYSKGRFDSEIKFVLPCWMDNRLLGNYDYWKNAKFDDLDLLELTFVRSMIRYEVSYMSLLDKGWKPEQARVVLPNATATELVMTGFESDWQHFFDLRAKGITGRPHPQAMELAVPLMEELCTD